MRKRYNKELKTMIAELLLSGQHPNTVADEYGIHASTARLWKRQYNRSGSFYRLWYLLINPRRKGNSPFKKTVERGRIRTRHFKKGHKHLLCERQERYEFIEHHRGEFSVERMCKCLGVSRNAYYKWKRKWKEVTKVESRTATLKRKIRAIWKENRKVYGSPKITKILQRQGDLYHESYISRLMKEMGIKSLTRRKYVVTTDSRHSYQIHDNVLDRTFEVEQLGKVWVSDITYIRCNDQWLYLTSVIDLADRKVIGWSLSKEMTSQNTVYQAWINARKHREITEGFIFHSDRGVQYAAHQMSELFRLNIKVTQSMSRKGNCWDNAVAESFFRSIKCEMVYLNDFNYFQQVFQAIKEYIDWYNTNRIHQGLGYLTPIEKERILKNQVIKRAA
ncbi:IS3 family transposase [Chondrinema litorale]|uniref:IS3 family transposase n=1 Tax=Chondrinema litorale TaxID=2994555 RepID=UPI002542ABB4|nr:IS3 family transposase [Chondrinema litorale]UZS00138.1 IS3 family transposase [Chondrinema litorale]